MKCGKYGCRKRCESGESFCPEHLAQRKADASAHQDRQAAAAGTAKAAQAEAAKIDEPASVSAEDRALFGKFAPPSPKAKLSAEEDRQLAEDMGDYKAGIRPLERDDWMFRRGSLKRVTGPRGGR